MAITTLNGVLAGFQPGWFYQKVLTPTLIVGRLQSLWQLAGIPGAGTLNGTLAGANYSSTSALVNGQIYHTDPGGGVSSYLARWQIQANGSPGTILLCDRIWDNQLGTGTGVQNINTSTWPSRDANGLTNGDGILAGLEISATTSATAAALTNYTYTNQAGLGSRTGGFIDSPTAVGATAGMFFRLSLQGGDTGIRSIQSIQFSTNWTSGTINMVAYRILAVLECPLSAQSNNLDPVTSGFPLLYNGVVPYVMFEPQTTTTTSVIGYYEESQG